MLTHPQLCALLLFCIITFTRVPHQQIFLKLTAVGLGKNLTIKLCTLLLLKTFSFSFFNDTNYLIVSFVRHQKPLIFFLSFLKTTMLVIFVLQKNCAINFPFTFQCACVGVRCFFLLYRKIGG